MLFLRQMLSWLKNDETHQPKRNGIHALADPPCPRDFQAAACGVGHGGGNACKKWRGNHDFRVWHAGPGDFCQP